MTSRDPQSLLLWCSTVLATAWLLVLFIAVIGCRFLNVTPVNGTEIAFFVIICCQESTQSLKSLVYGITSLSLSNAHWQEHVQWQMAICAL